MKGSARLVGPLTYNKRAPPLSPLSLCDVPGTGHAFAPRQSAKTIPYSGFANVGNRGSAGAWPRASLGGGGGGGGGVKGGGSAASMSGDSVGNGSVDAMEVDGRSVGGNSSLHSSRGDRPRSAKVRAGAWAP